MAKTVENVYKSHPVMCSKLQIQSCEIYWKCVLHPYSFPCTFPCLLCRSPPPLAQSCVKRICRKKPSTTTQRAIVCLSSHSNVRTSGLHTLSALYCTYPPIYFSPFSIFFFFFVTCWTCMCISLTDSIEIRAGFSIFCFSPSEGNRRQCHCFFGARC